MAWIKQNTQHLYFFDDANRERVNSLARLANKHGADNVKVRIRKRTYHGEVTGFDVITWTRSEPLAADPKPARKPGRNEVDVDANRRKVARSMRSTAVDFRAAGLLAFVDWDNARSAQGEG